MVLPVVNSKSWGWEEGEVQVASVQNPLVELGVR